MSNNSDSNSNREEKGRAERRGEEKKDNDNI